jgi:superfamily II DNA or RNA helicase
MSARHRRAAEVVARGLYRDLRSFYELETRIAALPEELDRGDAFEVFTEAYLCTSRVFQVAELWPVGQVPLDVRRTLNLPADAKGIDGVLRTKVGLDVPYQVKFRIGRPLLGVAEVAPFLGVTERAADRLLISNTDTHATDIVNRDGLRFLRGTDFDALTPDDLTAISDWLDARPAVHPRAVPRDPDQRQAIAKIGETLRSQVRATVVMPCGTGKTLVQLWAAEQHGAQTVLVLVPSLALLSQTLAEWSRHTAWGDRFEYLCVCSDPSVSAEQDAIIIRATDVPFHVDTDPAIVRAFLDRPLGDAVRVVFCTYQSAAVVAAGINGLTPFDLGIFDEAHKTTGPKDGVFALALDDARLAIRKRLFLTATPRHIDIRHRDKEGDFRVASMDDSAVYGPRAYQQSFAEAVDLKIICDYKVVVAVVDPEEVTAFALKHGITLVEGDQQATRWVAGQIAISKAITATGSTKVITFHSRVQHADVFASDGPRGIRRYLDGFTVDHVNGRQRVSDRKRVLAGFRDATRRLVTNARCLTEGVDLPAVDMVAFIDPRKSRIDIVQAVGRAMRRPQAGTKELGYVVVPVLLAPDDTGSVEEACAHTDWKDLIDVLAALREHDARLDETIRQQCETRGRGEVFNPRIFAERMHVLGTLVAVDVLERSITTVILDALGVSWDEMYGRLVAYQRQHGDCNVTRGEPQLGNWVNNQRARKARLSADQIARLNTLHFAWDPHDADWERMYAALEAYKDANRHCDVSPSENRQLGNWVNNQRARKAALSADQIARLNSLGFVWDAHDAYWEQMYGALVAFKEANDHCDVSTRHSTLGHWVNNLRNKKRLGTLSADRIAELNGLGFVWNRRDADWENMYAALVAFNEAHGHCAVPSEYPKDPRLGRWVKNQRVCKSTRSADQIARLNALGFVWDKHDSQWENMLAVLVAYKAKNRHCNVPYSYLAEDGQALGSWCYTQRNSKKNHRLAPNRITRLTELGFVWESRDAQWAEMFGLLVAYKVKNGHCNVPQNYQTKDGQALGTWCDRQRRVEKNHRLAPNRITRLTELGFVWKPGQ